MTRLIVVRHGQTDWNVAGRLQGASDIPLNDTGRAQAAAAAQRLATMPPPDALVSSDLVRAAETASAIGDAWSRAVTADARLRERAYGVWEGLAVDERSAQYPEEHGTWLRGEEPAIDGYESHEAIRVRVTQAVADHLVPGGTTVFVSHGSTLRVLVCALLGLPLGSRRIANLGNAQWAQLDRAGDGPWVLASLNAW